MKYNTLTNLNWILKNSWKVDKLIFVYIFIYAISNSVLPLIFVVLPKVIIDYIEKQKNIDEIISVIFMFILVYFVCLLLVRASENLSWPRYIVIRMKIKKLAADKFMTMKQGDIENPKILDLCERANQASSYNVNGFEGMFRRFVKILGVALTFIGCISIISIISFWMIILIIICVTVQFIFNTQAREYEKQMNDCMLKLDRKRDYVFNSMYNLKNGKDIRLYHMNDWLVKAFRSVSKERRSKLQLIEKKKRNSNVVGNIMTAVIELSLYVILIKDVLYNNLSIGSFMMGAAAIRTLFSTLSTMLDDLAHIRQQSLIVNDLIEFIEYNEEKENIPTNIKFDFENTYKIEFRNVSFCYPGSNKNALNNISLIIKKGEKLGIVGLNGSGKTTLIKLLTKLYEPTSGQILINDIDIQNIKREEYYKLFSVVFQDIIVFPFSVLENVSMLKSSVTNKEKVDEVLNKAGLLNKINSLPEGAETKLLKIIDENGLELSGGESQKLALARALYRQAPYLILDEPTASLDALAEKQIYTTFNEIVNNKTAIFISHRLSSTKFCDMIAMFEYGDLIEYGNHEALLNKQGKYYDMFQVQAKYYKDEEVAYE